MADIIQHRSEIEYIIFCQRCKKPAAYTPTRDVPQWSGVYCWECNTKLKSAQGREQAKRFRKAQGRLL